MRGKWIKTKSYPSDLHPAFEAKIEKIIMEYHHGKISKAEFDRKMAELYGEPLPMEKFFGSKKK